MIAGGHLPPVSTSSTRLTCPECARPWPCAGWREHRHHRPSLVLELVAVAPHFGSFCLACAKPWPCPDAPTGDHNRQETTP